MPDNTNQIDALALTSVLLQAKIRLDNVVAHLKSPKDVSLLPKRALEDNNSTCNTACTCGALTRLGREEQ
jgi:hypothetical protein